MRRRAKMSVAAGWSCGVRLLKVYSRKKLNIFANKLYKVLPGSILGQVCQGTCVANGIAAGATGRQREGLRMREKEASQSLYPFCARSDRGGR
jgi:hypothetical protein